VKYFCCISRSVGSSLASRIYYLNLVFGACCYARVVLALVGLMACSNGLGDRLLRRVLN
jgi:hypothetical protein